MTVQAAGLFLYRSTDHGPEWLLVRNQRRHEWGLPKGHAEKGETTEQTARRECLEETGIALLAFTGPQWTTTYTLPSGRGRGNKKTVTYFLAETKQQSIVLSEEHDAYTWVSTEEAMRHLPYDSVKNLLQAAAQTIS